MDSHLQAGIHIHSDVFYTPNDDCFGNVVDSFPKQQSLKSLLLLMTLFQTEICQEPSCTFMQLTSVYWPDGEHVRSDPFYAGGYVWGSLPPIRHPQ